MSIKNDTKWGIAAFGCLFIIAFLVTKSLMITCYSVMISIFSIAVTQLIYEGVFKITYFGTPHGIVIILLILVSTSNIFLITDIWE